MMENRSRHRITVLQTASVLAVLAVAMGSPVNSARASSTSLGGCQCTDYVYSQRPEIPRGMGNAKDWISSAQKRGYPYSQVPEVGDVAVFQPGSHGASVQYGHVAIVTWVNDSHTKYNIAGWDGLKANCILETYSNLSILPNDWFIHQIGSGPTPTAPAQTSTGEISFDPVSPAQVGRIVTITVRVKPAAGFRAARLLIDYTVASESSATEFSYSWNTSGLLPSIHSIRLEIASSDDTNWIHPTSYDMSYLLREAEQPANRAPNVPSPVSPVNGQTVAANSQLCWRASGDPEGDPVTSRAEVTGGGSWTGPWMDGDNPCWTPSEAGVPAGVHSWAVRARDSKGAESGASPEWSFTLEESSSQGQGPVTLTASPSTVAAGDAVSVSWQDPAPTGNDWISLHPAAAADSEYIDWKYASGASGTLAFSAPSTPGSYNFRMFRNGTKVAVSNDFQVTALAAPPTTACAAPPIEDLSFNPSSPAVIGATVSVHAKATWNSCFRSMRLLIDGGKVYEQSSAEWTWSWNTASYIAGGHTVRLEVAALGDNSWSNPSVREASYSLQARPTETPAPCTAPPIEDLSFSPGSPATIGTVVSVHAKATWNSCFRSMRLLIDGGKVYEQSSAEWTWSWNTAGYSAGGHTIRLEVAALGDNSWSYPSVRESNFSLTAVGLSKPVLISPSNGALLPPGTDVSLQWNSVSGATQYIVEIWGGQYGGTHTAICGWQSGTSCHIGTMSPGNVMWRVKARDSTGNESPWSDEWNFTPQ